jgi:hypothetical protein
VAVAVDASDAAVVAEFERVPEAEEAMVADTV